MAETIRTWTEAPCSVTIKTTLRGYDVMLTLRGETGADVLPKTMAALDWLQANGGQPTTAHGNGGGANADPNAPLCPTHGKPMQRSKHGGGWFCPVKIAEDGGDGKPVYCKQKVK